VRGSGGWNDARGSGLRHFPADTHLIDWLTAKGIAVDVVTEALSR
jgi:N,N-dimethylformamidase